MTKRSGLGSSFYVGAYDLSGDIGSVSGIEARQALGDVSSIQSSGTERIGLRLDGSIRYASFWNATSSQAVPVLSDLAGSEQVSVVKGPTGIGADVASLLAVKVNFSSVLGQDGSLGASGQAQGAQGVTIEWGKLLTAGKATISATQLVAAWQASTAYSLNAFVQPTSANGHYYKATASTGSSGLVEPTWPTNGTTVADGDVTWTDQGLLPNGIDRGVGSESNYGAAAYLHAFSIGSGSATVKVQDSADRIAWADVPGLAFTAVTGPTSQRVATGTTENVKRYVRVYVTGTFTNLVAAVSVVPYRIAQ